MLTAFCILLQAARPAHAQPQTQGPAGVTGSPTPGMSQADPLDPAFPSRPEAPPQLNRRLPLKSFQCARHFVYRGKLLECDSKMSQDGENLRPILAPVPAALDELNTYQDNRRRVRILAYTGTAGLLLAGAALLATSGRDSVPSSVIVARNLVAGLGLTMTAGSILYGISFLANNEQHLNEAVRIYNEARPNDSIELQFTTGIRF